MFFFSFTNQQQNGLAFPYLWVNGEKYIFSTEVLESGRRLFFSFCKIQHIVRNLYACACQDNAFYTAFLIRKEMCRNLEEFDLNWVSFEQVINSPPTMILFCCMFLFSYMF